MVTKLWDAETSEDMASKNKEREVGVAISAGRMDERMRVKQKERREVALGKLGAEFDLPKQ